MRGPDSLSANEITLSLVINRSRFLVSIDFMRGQHLWASLPTEHNKLFIITTRGMSTIINIKLISRVNILLSISKYIIIRSITGTIEQQYTNTTFFNHALILKVILQHLSCSRSLSNSQRSLTVQKVFYHQITFYLQFLILPRLIELPVFKML